MPTVYLTPESKKDLLKLPLSEQKKIKRKLEMLETDMFLGKKLSGELKGLYSVKSWPYRVIYEILSKNKIVVSSIIHRQEGYKKIG